MKKGEYKKTRMLDDGKTYANFAATIYRDKICVILHRRTNKKLQVYQYGDPELNSGWDWCGTVRNAGHDNIELKGSTGISMEYDSRAVPSRHSATAASMARITYGPPTGKNTRITT